MMYLQNSGLPFFEFTGFACCATQFDSHTKTIYQHGITTDMDMDMDMVSFLPSLYGCIRLVSIVDGP